MVTVLKDFDLRILRFSNHLPTRILCPFSHTWVQIQPLCQINKLFYLDLRRLHLTQWLQSGDMGGETDTESTEMGGYFAGILKRISTNLYRPMAREYGITRHSIIETSSHAVILCLRFLWNIWCGKCNAWNLQHWESVFTLFLETPVGQNKKTKKKCYVGLSNDFLKIDLSPVQHSECWNYPLKLQNNLIYDSPHKK